MDVSLGGEGSEGTLVETAEVQEKWAWVLALLVLSLAASELDPSCRHPP